MILRDYQHTLHDEIVSAWDAGHQNVLAVLATGGGKTVTFAHIVKEESGASVVLAHRGELVAQMSLALVRDLMRTWEAASPVTSMGQSKAKRVRLQEQQQDCWLLRAARPLPSLLGEFGLPAEVSDHFDSYCHGNDGSPPATQQRR